MKKIVSTIFCAALSASTVLADTFIDAKGEVTLDGAPKRIVVFDLAPLDTLNALDAEVLGVTQSFARGYLDKFSDDKYVDVGTFFEPDIETTASIEPDLIILGPRSAKFNKEMSAIAPTFDSSILSENFLDNFYTMTRTLADIVDKEAEAEAQLQVIQSQIDEIKSAAPNVGNALFILTNGGKISAFGPGSRFGWIHDDLGIVPAIKDVEAATHGEPITFEFLQKVNPDWLFVLDRDSAIGKKTGAAAALLDNEMVNSMKASQNDHIIYVDGMSWYLVGSGMTAIQNMIGQIHEAMAITP